MLPIALCVCVATLFWFVYTGERTTEAARTGEIACSNDGYRIRESVRLAEIAAEKELNRVREAELYAASARLADPWEGEGSGVVLISETDSLYDFITANMDCVKVPVFVAGTDYTALRLTASQRDGTVSEAEEAPFAALSLGTDFPVSQYDMLVLKFNMRSYGRSAQFNVVFLDEKGDVEYSMLFTAPAQWTEVYMPVTVRTESESVSIRFQMPDTDAVIEICSIELRNLGRAFDGRMIKSGQFLLEEYKTYYLNEQGVGLGATEDLVTDGEYLYSVQRDKLTVSSLKTPGSPKKVASLSGLGNVRHVALLNGGLIVTSREYGAFMVDISDKNKPVIAAHYDTLELATGVYVLGDYAFIASRYFGVEIVDVSDIYNPVFVAVIRSEDMMEYQDVCVSDGYAYIGVWGQYAVDIWDVSDVSDPSFVSRVNLDGRGYGVFVEGTTLFAATGMISPNGAWLRSMYDMAFGSGYGMEIYDVSDPASPVWLSTVKVDGRGYGYYDQWKIQVSDGFAYLASSFNGLFIYDVSDLTAPVRVARILAQIGAHSQYFRRGLLPENYFYPWDNSLYMQDYITSLALCNGWIYMSGPVVDARAFRFEKASAPAQAPQIALTNSGTPQDYSITGFEQEALWYKTDHSVHAASVHGDYIFIAAGDGGIQVLDMDLNLVCAYPCGDIVRDILINGDILIAAEGMAGLGIYEISSSGELEKLSHVPSGGEMFSSIFMADDDKSLIVQSTFTGVTFINISNPRYPVKTGRDVAGLMYYRQTPGGRYSSRYMAALTLTGIRWYDSYDGFSFSTNGVFSEYNGMCYLEDGFAIVIQNGGYLLIYPSRGAEASFSELYRINDVYLQGKAAVYGDLLVVSAVYGGQVYLIDISNVREPSLISVLTISGHPDVAYIADGFILIPARRQGLIKLMTGDI